MFKNQAGVRSATALPAARTRVSPKVAARSPLPPSRRASVTSDSEGLRRPARSRSPGPLHAVPRRHTLLSPPYSRTPLHRLRSLSALSSRPVEGDLTADDESESKVNPQKQLFSALDALLDDQFDGDMHAMLFQLEQYQRSHASRKVWTSPPSVETSPLVRPRSLTGQSPSKPGQRGETPPLERIARVGNDALSDSEEQTVYNPSCLDEPRAHERKLSASYTVTGRDESQLTSALLHIHLVEARNLMVKPDHKTSDPFCKFHFRDPKAKHAKLQKCRSSTKLKTVNPLWDEYFTLGGVNLSELELVIDIQDHDKKQFRSYQLGRVVLPLKRLEPLESVLSWFPMVDRKNETKACQGSILLVLCVQDSWKRPEERHSRQFVTTRHRCLYPTREDIIPQNVNLDVGAGMSRRRRLRRGWGKNWLRRMVAKRDPGSKDNKCQVRPVSIHEVDYASGSESERAYERPSVVGVLHSAHGSIDNSPRRTSLTVPVDSTNDSAHAPPVVRLSGGNSKTTRPIPRISLQPQKLSRRGSIDLNFDVPEVQLSIFVGSWNVGNARPDDDLSAFLPTDTQYDLCVVGTQECKYPISPHYQTCLADWLARLSTHFGSQYNLVKYNCLQQIRLAVFCRSDLRQHIAEEQTFTEATGIGNVIGNKGAVVISLTVLHTTLCFVNAHLAAHQGKIADRNTNVVDIVRNIHVGPGGTNDLIHQFEHVFWMGDLNYRLDYGEQKDARQPSKQDFDAMVEDIKHENFDKLLLKDQLLMERKGGRVFAGFQEGEINFAPTFKVVRDTAELDYQEIRSPAWCDRILWHSFPGCSAQLTSMTSCPKVVTSDHKPVVATFSVLASTLPEPSEASFASCTMTLSDLVGEGMRWHHTARKSARGKEKKERRESKIHKDFGSKRRLRFSGGCLAKPLMTPFAKVDEPFSCQDLVADLQYTSKKRLAHSHLLVELIGSDDDVFGRGIISLQPACDEKTEFDCELTFGTLPSGILEGIILLHWVRINQDNK